MTDTARTDATTASGVSHDRDQQPERREIVRSTPGTNIALIATFAALIAACAVLPAINVGGSLVPITLQTFAIMLTGAVLGWRRAALAVLLYIVVAVAGVPIFSQGRSGPGVFLTPSAGYIAAFPLAAMIAGALVARIPSDARRSVQTGLTFASCVAASALTIHPLGIVGWMVNGNQSFTEAIASDVIFLPGDLIKSAAAAVVATAILRAFPDLLPRRRP